LRANHYVQNGYHDEDAGAAALKLKEQWKYHHESLEACPEQRRREHKGRNHFFDSMPSPFRSSSHSSDLFWKYGAPVTLSRAPRLRRSSMECWNPGWHGSRWSILRTWMPAIHAGMTKICIFILS